MFGRTPRQARALGLWTACWLFALLLAGLLRFGDITVQWPVLLIPVLWALVALRPRRRRGRVAALDRAPVARRPAGPDPVDADEPDVVDPELQWYRRRAVDPRGFPERHEPRTREQRHLPGVPPPPRPRREE